MSRQWPKVTLGEVLRRSEETIQPQAEAEYREITVRLRGNGVVARRRVLGASLSGRRFVARTGQFIAWRIDARNGAMGLVPESLDGALVTKDFPLFELNAERLEPAFLGWLCRTAGFVELCSRASEGATNRVRLKEKSFLAVEIPLPPLAEQRRVVARIEELAAQIHQAGILRQQAAEEAQAVLGSHRRHIFGEAECSTSGRTRHSLLASGCRRRYRVEIVRGFILYLHLSIENLLKDLLVHRLKAQTRVFRVEQIRRTVEDMRSRDIAE